LQKIKQADGRSLAFISGELGLDPKTYILVEVLVPRTDQALTNLKNLTADNGFDIGKQVIKNNFNLPNMNDFVQVNEIFKN
jgi:enamine deaminase RidA (YjgF/YER057c/UK114 family)